MTKNPYYYVSGCILTQNKMKHIQIVEEKDGQQTIIAFVPYNPSSRDGWSLAMKDARMIVDALNKMNVHDK